MEKNLFLLIFILQIVKKIFSNEIQIIPNHINYSLNNMLTYNKLIFIINTESDYEIAMHLQLKIEIQLNIKFYKGEEIIENLNSDKWDYFCKLKPDSNYKIQLTTINEYQISFLYQYLFDFKNEFIQDLNLGYNKDINFIFNGKFPFYQPMNNIFEKEIIEYELEKLPKDYNYRIYYKIFNNLSLKEIENNFNFDILSYKEFKIENNKFKYENDNQKFSKTDFLIIIIEIIEKKNTPIYNNLILHRNLNKVQLTSDFDISLITNETKKFNSKNNLIPFMISSTEIEAIKIDSYENQNVPNLNQQLFFYPYKMYNSILIDNNNRVNENKCSLRFLTKETKVLYYFIQQSNSIQRIDLDKKSNRFFLFQDYINENNELKFILYPKIIYGDVSVYLKNFSTDLNYILDDKKEYSLNYPQNIDSKNIILIKSNENSSLYINYLIKSENKNFKNQDGESYLISIPSLSNKNIIIDCSSKTYYLIEIIQNSLNNKGMNISNNNFNQLIKERYKNNTLEKITFNLINNNEGDLYVLLKFALNQSKYQFIEKETYNILLKKNYTVILYNPNFPSIYLNFKNTKNYMNKICFYEDFIEKEYIYSPQNISYCLEINNSNYKTIKFQKPKNNNNKLDYFIVLYHNKSEIKIDYYIDKKSSLLFYVIIGIIAFIIILSIIIFLIKKYKTKLELQPTKNSIYLLLLDKLVN
jgi:hypothetical protein